MTESSFAGYVDQLVAGARSSRDAVVNTLDAINRRTRAASAEIRDQVEQFTARLPSDQRPQPSAAGGSSRFAPEDEWDLPAGTPMSAQPATVPPEEDEDEYPDTWLR